MLVGIDPGATGAIAWMSDTGRLLEVCDLPTAKVNGRSKMLPGVLAHMLLEREKPDMVWLEEVGAMPRDGAVGAFSFGRSYGQIEGVLAAMDYPMTSVRPTVWKRDAGLLHADKGASRMRACELWPAHSSMFSRVRDDGRAEAALIARYGFLKKTC